MGQKTAVAYGDPSAVKLQAAGLFAGSMQRPTTMNRLVGPMPKMAEAESKTRLQSHASYPIVQCRDFGKGSGDEVKFDFVNPVNAKPSWATRRQKAVVLAWRCPTAQFASIKPASLLTWAA